MAKTSKPLIGGVVVVILALTAGGVWWFLRDDAPEKVTLESATGSAETKDGTTKASAGGTDSADSGPEVQGDWVVDTETETFDRNTGKGTFAGFRVDEELANIGSSTAVGRTGAVSGSLTIKGTEVTKADFAVELAGLQTDNNMRDTRIRQILKTDSFPQAKLALKRPIQLPKNAASIGKITVETPAELTIRGITKEVNLSLEGQYIDGRIVIVGSAPVTFSDFEIEVPTNMVVLSVKDQGELEVQLYMKRK